MLLSVWICGVLVSASSAFLYDVQDQSVYSRAKRSGVYDEVNQGSVFLRGAAVERALIDDAKPLYVTDRYRAYRRSGGYMAALQLYESFKPSNERTSIGISVTLRYGIVGDRRLTLQESTNFNSASILVLQRLEQSTYEKEKDIIIFFARVLVPSSKN